MSPIAHYEAVWARCNQISAVHAYLAANVTPVVQPDELLRAEWVARVCALDLYIHELVAQKMLDVFEGRRVPSSAYLRFELSADTLHRVRTAATPSAASASYDLEVRDRLSRITYQDPEKIADGIRLISAVELWNAVATNLGAIAATRTDEAKRLKQQLSLIVRRRNQIAHEGDLQPGTPRAPWPISMASLAYVADLIDKIVRSIELVI